MVESERRIPQFFVFRESEIHRQCANYQSLMLLVRISLPMKTNRCFLLIETHDFPFSFSSMRFIVLFLSSYFNHPFNVTDNRILCQYQLALILIFLRYLKLYVHIHFLVSSAYPTLAGYVSICSIEEDIRKYHEGCDN